MVGREVLPEGSVSAIAAPLRLNSIIAVDAMAIARFEKKRDENFIVMSPKCVDSQSKKHRPESVTVTRDRTSSHAKRPHMRTRRQRDG
jgi:hypothetical protein